MDESLAVQGTLISDDEAVRFRDECGASGSLGKLEDWMDAGFSFYEATAWTAAGISRSEAAAWKKSGRSAEQAVAEIKRQEAEVVKERIKLAEKYKALGYDYENEKTELDLIKANPYTVKGLSYNLGKRCEGQQLFDRTSGMYVIGYSNHSPVFAVLIFDPDDAVPPNVYFTCRAIGIGPYEYTSVIGAGQVVPSLKVVSVTDYKTRKTIYITSSSK